MIIDFLLTNAPIDKKKQEEEEIDFPFNFYSDCLGGMRITTSRGEDHEVVTTLLGQLHDQAALVGVQHPL